MSRTFKWILTIAALCLVAVGLVFILKSNTPEPEPEVSAFSEYLMQDFNYAKTFEKDSTHVAFYEVETILNGDIREVPADSLAIVSSLTVFAVDDTVYMLTRTWETGEVVTEKKAGTWVGDFAIEHPELGISFEQAVELLHKAAADSVITLPGGDKMTFRRPVGPDDLVPLYIFGTQGTSFASVNSVTGEVKPVE